MLIATLPSTIVSLEAEPLDLPLREPFAIATGAQATAHNALITVKLRDGSVGRGEAAPFPAVSGETQGEALSAVARVSEWLVGEDARRLRPLTRRMREAEPAHAAARAGIEMALHDALGHHYRTPLWVRWGGQGTTLETDMTVTAGDAAHAAEAARACLSRGMRVLKIKVGRASPEEDAERLAAIAAVISAQGSPARLTLDANGGFEAQAALQLLRLLSQRGVVVDLFEQPVARDDWDGLVEVSRGSPVPVCADESLRSLVDLQRIIRLGAAKVVNLKLMKLGLLEAAELWAAARAAGLGLMIGAMVEGPLAIAAAAHFAAGLGGFDHVDLDTHLFMDESDTFAGGFAQEGPRITLYPDLFGHGVRCEGLRFGPSSGL